MEAGQKRFSDTQIEMANNINIVAYAKSRGYELKRISDNSYKLPGYGGLFISGDGSKWNWFSQSKGGGAIQFLMEVEGKSWLDSVKELLGMDYDEFPVVSRKQESEAKQKLILPEVNHTYKHVFAYLIKGRHIDKEVVSDFVEKKMLYEDINRNCVFVGFNNQDEPAFASRRSARTVGKAFRGDVKNSDKSWPFYYEGSSKTVCVFESPIDLMSYLSLLKCYDIKDFDHHMISLGGVTDLGLMSFLKRNQAIERIVLCLDNDQAGSDACLRLGIKLQDNYELRRHNPVRKDFNEDLLNVSSNNCNKAREPPFEEEEGLEL